MPRMRSSLVDFSSGEERFKDMFMDTFNINFRENESMYCALGPFVVVIFSYLIQFCHVINRDLPSYLIFFIPSTGDVCEAMLVLNSGFARPERWYP